MESISKKIMMFCLLLPAWAISQITPGDEEAYYGLSQQLVLELARHPENMDSLWAEIDTLDTLLKGKKKTDIKAGDGVTRIYLQYRSAMCEGYCTIEITVSPRAKTVKRYPQTMDDRPSDLPFKNETIALDENDWEKIRDSFSLDKIKELPKTIGCPGCDDGPIATLNVFTENDRYEIEFEGPDPPESFRELVRRITADVFKE